MARPTANSQRELAAAVGRSQPAIVKWMRHPEWPFGRSGPWDVEKVRAWAETLQEDRSDDADDGGGQAAKVSLGLKLEKMLHERVKRKRAEGSVVERTLLDRAMEALAKLFVSSLEELERALPLQIAGLDPGQVEKVVKDRVRSIREQLASRQVIELDAIDQAVKLQSQPKARGRPGSRR